ncbi:MAG: DEAD/DEAH box helicase [Cyclobacteriaceae bacterium]
MAESIKNQQRILDKLKIKSLNPMQEETHLAIESASDVVLLSPTGTGKTLAFLLPIIKRLDVSLAEVQALIVVPSRELAIQIEQVIREMGSGFKTNAVYGGRAGSKDKMELKHRPAILIGTPGRVADHLRRETFAVDRIETLVLDEFDKSLEVGFEEEMTEILGALPKVKKRVLTSATQEADIPKFVRLLNPIYVNYLDEKLSQLEIKILGASGKNKPEALIQALGHINGLKPGQGIVFCNFKDTIQQVSNALEKNGISHGCFYGGMEQKDRERALIKFRNGTHQLIVATDLAARGIDIPDIKFIIHYQMPPRIEEFTHRNGRTARMKSDGTAYVLRWKEERMPEYIKSENLKTQQADNGTALKRTAWQTLFISGGRKDKISKGDVAGLFLKQGKLNQDELGVIEIKQDCAFVGVHSSKTKGLIPLVDNSRLKKKKVRVTLI